MLRSASLLGRRACTTALNTRHQVAPHPSNSVRPVYVKRCFSFRCYSLAVAEDDSSQLRSNEGTNELQENLRPSQIVDALNNYVVGQQDAKRAVAIALRNRWRRRLLPEELRKEIVPRNVLLVGPTGT